MNRKEFFLEEPWGRLAVVTYNSEDLPLVIFCHGRSDSADTFLPLIEHLPPTHHYVTFDLPGCGYSDKLSPGSVLTTFSYLPTIKAVSNHYGDKKFIFVGHSGGAELGMLYNFITEGTRITKFVDIDFFFPVPVKVHDLTDYGPFAATLDKSLTLKDWINLYFMNFYQPNNLKKYNASMETAPSYTIEQAVALMVKSRHLTPRTAEIALQRNLRPDPKNAGKFKLVWDQRMKVGARPPFDAEYWLKLRRRHPLPTLALVTTSMFQFLTSFSGVDLQKALQQSMPYFKMVEFDSYHDLQLIMPEKIAPYMTEFMEMDLGTVRSKEISKM